LELTAVPETKYSPEAPGKAKQIQWENFNVFWISFDIDAVRGIFGPVDSGSAFISKWVAGEKIFCIEMGDGRHPELCCELGPVVGSRIFATPNLASANGVVGFFAHWQNG